MVCCHHWTMTLLRPLEQDKCAALCMLDFLKETEVHLNFCRTSMAKDFPS